MELPDATIQYVLDADERLQAGENPHDVIRDVARQAHINSIGLLGGRLKTIPQIAEQEGVSEELVRKQIAIDPPVEPVMSVMNIPLFAVEQIDDIMTRHLVNTDTNRHVMTYINKAVKGLRNTRTVEIIRKRPEVKYPHWNGKLVEVKIYVNPWHAKWIRGHVHEEGWRNASELLSTLIERYMDVVIERRSNANRNR